MYKARFFNLIALGIFFLWQGNVLAKTPVLTSCDKNESVCASQQTCAKEIIGDKKYCFTQCASSSTCPTQWYCHPKHHLCHHYCKDQADCPEGHICTHEVSGKKEGPPLCLKQCKSESDCAAPLYCNKNTHICQKYCEQDSDCPEGKICHKKKKKCKSR